MPMIKFSEVLAFSSEDHHFPAENLLKPDSYLKWKCKEGHNEKQEFVILKLENLASISSIDIGNEYSAFVEVLVSRDGSSYEVLLVASSFMSPLESRNGTSANRVRMFGLDKLNKKVAEEKWERVKIVCTQPFNKKVQYGLAFFKLTSPTVDEGKLGKFSIGDDLDDSKINIGTLFAERKEQKSPRAGPAAIREASKKAVATERSKDSKRTSDDSLNAPHMEFYQLKKKAKESPQSTLTPPKATQKKNSTKESKSARPPEVKVPQKPSKPFNQLMSDVVFVLSGYQNPLRSQLRDSLTSMGAKYKGDWSRGCTHLICAFKNTPKYNSVKGKGKIVTDKWVQECSAKKIRFPWRRFTLDDSEKDEESEEEIWASEFCPGESSKPRVSHSDKVKYSSSEDTDDEIQRVMDKKIDKKEKVKSPDVSPKKDAKKSPRKTSPQKNTKKSPQKAMASATPSKESEEDYDADTDVDEEILATKDTRNLKLPTLKSFFKGKTFFMFGDKINSKSKSLVRYIVAYGGEVSDYMDDQVNFVLTDETWDENFDEALEQNSSLQFVKPQWIWKCCDKEKILPPQPYLIVPNSD